MSSDEKQANLPAQAGAERGHLDNTQTTGTTWSRVANLPKRHPYVLILLGCIVLQFALLGGTGSLTCGYHYMDNHVILEIDHDLKTKGNIFKVAYDWGVEDLDIRFRPLCFAERVLGTATLGTNLVAWSIYRGLVVALAAFLLCCFARLMGLSWMAALPFPAFCLIGSQGCIAWMLGVLEPLGLLLFSGALVTCAASFKVDGKTARALMVASALLGIGSSLFKESFIIELSALAFVAVWLARNRTGCTGWWEALRSQLLFVTILGAVGLIEVLIIIKWVGTNRITYAGVDTDTLVLAKLLAPLIRTRGFLTHQWLRVACLSIIVAWIWSVWRHRTVMATGIDFAKRLAAPAIFAALIVIPQVILYAKSGKLFGWYMIPGMLGVAFFSVWVLDYVRNMSRWAATALLFVMLLGLVKPARQELTDIHAFVASGKTIGSFLKRIEDTTNRESNILVVTDCVDNWEETVALHSYLKHVFKRDNVFVLFLSEPAALATQRRPTWFDFRGEIERIYEGKTFGKLLDRNTIACIAITYGQEQRFLKDARDWFTLTDYDRWSSVSPEEPADEALVMFSRKP